MKNIFACFSFFLFFVISADLFSHDDPVILDIRRKFYEINKNIGSYRKVRITPEEGDPATVFSYFSGQNLKKIEYQSGDNMHSRKIDYYFWNGPCVFVYDRVTASPAPNNSWKSSQDRFYFNKGKLYRWRTTSGSFVFSTNSRYKFQEKIILSMARDLVKRSRQRSP